MFNLDSAEKSVSIILGLATILSVLLRKFLIPRIVSLFKAIRNLYRVLRDLSRVSENIKIQDDIQELYRIAYVNKHKIVILFDNLKVGFYECDVKGEVIWASSALQDLINLSTEEMRREGWLNALHPDDMEITYQKWKKCVASQIPYKARFRVMPNPDGPEIIYCESVAVPIQDSKGNVISYFGILHVITKETFDN